MISNVNGNTVSASWSVAPSARYMSANRYKVHALFFGALLLLVSFILDLATGPGDLSFSEVINAILNKDVSNISLKIIVWDIRLPVGLMAIAIGAMLSVSGAQMQTILNNPLADPFTLGISSAASFGAAFAIVIGEEYFLAQHNQVIVIASAFLFSVLTSFVLFFFTRLRGASSETLVLVGVALLFTFNALLSLLQFSATDVQLQRIVFWMMGSLTRADWQKVTVCFLVLGITLPIFICRAWFLTSMRLGDEKAESLGVNTNRLRVEILFVVSFLSATAVSFVGTIAFVGLVGPHIARMIVGEDQRFFLRAPGMARSVMTALFRYAWWRLDD